MTCDLQGKYQLVSELYNIVSASWMKLQFYIDINNAESSHIKSFFTDRLLWSSGQSSWLQIQRSRFDSWRYQIFWEVVGLECGPLCLMRITEELFKGNSGSV